MRKHDALARILRLRQEPRVNVGVPDLAPELWYSNASEQRIIRGQYSSESGLPFSMQG